MDQLEQRVNEFFMNAKKNKQEWREEQMTSIKKVRIRQMSSYNKIPKQILEFVLNYFWV